jgi:Signal transduction histidine kinase
VNEDRPNRRRAHPEQTGGEDGRPRCPAAARAEALDFGLGDLPGVREHVAARARGAGMAEEAVGDLLVAVNEVATNAVTHGADRARLCTWHTARSFLVQIHDSGHWIPAGPPGRTPPGDYATSGMGLWVSSLLSEVIHFDCGPQGTTVTMGFSI